jgi:hypothetical protein
MTYHVHLTNTAFVGQKIILGFDFYPQRESATGDVFELISEVERRLNQFINLDRLPLSTQAIRKSGQFEPMIADRRALRSGKHKSGQFEPMIADRWALRFEKHGCGYCLT